MDFYTMVLRKSGPHWVVLCLENGIVGQGDSKDAAIENLRDAVASFEEVRKNEPDIYTSPLSIMELHEFLKVEGTEPILEPFEMRAMYA